MRLNYTNAGLYSVQRIADVLLGYWAVHLKGLGRYTAKPGQIKKEDRVSL
jgi:hypothetical protein